MDFDEAHRLWLDTHHKHVPANGGIVWNEGMGMANNFFCETYGGLCGVIWTTCIRNARSRIGGGGRTLRTSLG
ncbi:MAG: hypothetical protein E7E23_02785 [Paenibacillus sp.]|uniref:hypothetical protein n=1 Tax=Paenibacillus sp. TaxID=58172 RepID=UPI0028FE93AF|nr:hypothetical protein [Paenibacillus sp.]MDU2239476.1 hypothetical protein [Paenibacillus sp.]